MYLWELREFLCNFSCVGVPWIVLGNFNAIRSNSERVGGGILGFLIVDGGIRKLYSVMWVGRMENGG